MPFRIKQKLELPFIEAAHEVVRVEKEDCIEITERSSFVPPILPPAENFNLANQIAAGVPLKKVACTKQIVPNFVSENKD